jgi:flagellar assembly protein FliH
MPHPLRLEDFGGPPPAPFGAFDPDPAAGTEAAAEARLAGYDQGYAAGWEDALAAQAAEQGQVREDLARALHDLGFTFHEARAHLLRSLDPLLRALVDRVLPEIARASLGAAVVAELRDTAARLAGAPVVLEVAPGDRAAIAAALGEAPALPAELREDAALSEGQVRFRFGAEERALDLEALLGSIRALVADFLAAPSAFPERQARHG